MESIKKAVTPDDRQEESKELPPDRRCQAQKGCEQRHQDGTFFHHTEIHIPAAGPECTKKCDQFLFIDVQRIPLLTGSVWGRNQYNPPPSVHM